VVCGLCRNIADLADEGDLRVRGNMSVSAKTDAKEQIDGREDEKRTCVISVPSTLKSASGCGRSASTICLIVKGLRVSLP
jgi:hypothetical protein